MSHISETYQIHTQHKGIQDDDRHKYKSKLFIEHAKLLKRKNETDCLIKFEFKRFYMMEMLIFLIEDNNKNTKKIFKDERISASNEDELFC